MDSVYMRMHTINRCNHRDYQNMGVNGARSTSMADSIVQTLKRDPNNDHPVLLMLELVGNDVCNGHPGTSHMTQPDTYYAAQLKSLRHIDSVVPNGSHVIAVGLVDGRFLYDTLHSRIHPLGALRGDVTYADMYKYLECLGVTPCWGWLNANETWRNATTEWANTLNAQLQKLVATEKFNNFDLIYHKYDIQAAAKIWEARGGQDWQLIEPVDGFHASQLGNALGTDVFWSVIKGEKPEWFPPTNPHNDDIIKKFGDQGGY